MFYDWYLLLQNVLFADIPLLQWQADFLTLFTIVCLVSALYALTKLIIRFFKIF